jgi:Major Facilitator Superfamily
VGGNRRRARRGHVARFAEQRHGGEVAMTGGVLHMVGADRRSCAARRERSGRPLVRPEHPGLRGGLVDGAPDERVAEAEAPGHVGRPDEVEREQIVERRHRRLLVDLGGRTCEVGFERVFFALMGVMYFLTTYLQSVLGYDALEAGIRMLPIAAGLILATKLSVALERRFGTKLVVANGLFQVAGALFMITRFGVGTGYGEIALVLGSLGIGIGMAIAPATEAIMGALPPAKAGIGSAMNDVVREVGGTLGIAVLGSVLSSSYSSGMDDATAGMPAGAAEAASDSVGAAHEVAAHLGAAGGRLIDASNAAFVDAMTTTATIGAAVAVFGALIAAAFLPARAGRPAPKVPVLELEPAAA